MLEQLLATRLVDDLEPVVRARRAELAAARDHLLGRLGNTFPGWVPPRPSGGLSLWIDLGAPVSSRLVGAARREDVLLAAGLRVRARRRVRTVPAPAVHPAPRPGRAGADRLVTAWHTLDEAHPETEPTTPDPRRSPCTSEP